MIYAYIRVSTDKQSGSSQKFEICNWVVRNNLTVDKWVVESASGTIPPEKRKLGSTIRKMKEGDMLISTEISRLGRNVLMIMSVLNLCSERKIEIQTIKDNFHLSNDLNSKIIAFAFGLAAEIERNLISQRTKEALADKKAAGVKLGRPFGSYKQLSRIEEEGPWIAEQLSQGVSKTEIARHYGIHRNTLNKYLHHLLNKSHARERNGT